MFIFLMTLDTPATATPDTLFPFTALFRCETGRIGLTQAQRVRAESDAAEIAVQSLYTAPRGRRRVNLPLSFGIGHIAPLMPDFLALCPELHVDLSFSDRQIDRKSTRLNSSH